MVSAGMTMTGEVHELLNEGILEAEARQQDAFGQYADSARGTIVLFGAGTVGRKVLAGLRSVGIEPKAFSDNNPRLWNTTVAGLKVYEPREAVQHYGATAVFVVTIWSPPHHYRQTYSQLTGLGCARIVSFLALVWRYPQALLPHYCLQTPSFFLAHRADLLRVFDVLGDDESRRQFLGQLRWRLRLDFGYLPRNAVEDEYFLPELHRHPAEVFIDGGAFDGSTSRRFRQWTADHFQRIIAYEPDPDNCRRLNDEVALFAPSLKERISVRECALGRHSGRVGFISMGAPDSAVDSHATSTVEAVTLDDEMKGSPVTFIKLDVEGSELDALAGAQGTIRRHMPVLVVCLYHRPEALWEIPLYLHSLQRQYRMYLRSYNEDGIECIFYCLPPSRIKERVS